VTDQAGAGEEVREWYSICSSHVTSEPSCLNCHYGSWSDDPRSFPENLVRRDDI
jgi:hypothetical protein